jgi:hypothetical protein
MKSYVYLTTNLITGKKYVGKHSYSEFDPNYLGSGKHLKRSIKKYGKEHFSIEILAWFDTEQEAYLFEEKFINDNDVLNDPNYYNIAPGGKGFQSGTKHPNHTTNGGASFLKGRKFSEEHRRKLSQAKLGKKLSEEHKKNIALGNTGKVMSEESRKKVSQGNLGKKRSLEVRQLWSKLKLGKPLSESHKRKISEAHKKKIFIEKRNGFP